MATESNIYNAIGWGHLQLRGGWKNLLTTSVGYGTLMAVLMIATVRLNPDASASIMYGWTIGIIGMQAGMLLIFACMTLTGAVRMDHASKMIESHRIMPAPAPMAILGYLIGAPAQAMSMAAVNFILGAIAASGGQVIFPRWAMANLILLTFAIFVWVLVVFFGFLAQTSFRWIVTAFVIAFWITQGHLLLIFPAFTVLSSPLIGNSVFSMRTSAATLSWEYMASGAAQLLVAAICFAGAARKYRRADIPALGYDLGMLLLAAWVGISMLGLKYWDEFNPAWLRDDLTGDRVRFIATLLASMVVAIIPTAGAARARVKYERRLRVDDRGNPPKRPVSPIIVTTLAAVIPLLLLRVTPSQFAEIPRPLLPTAIVIISFLITLSYLVRLIGGDGRRVWLIPAAWIILTWTIPIMGDLMYHGLSGDYQHATGTISTMSPVGAIFETWTLDDRTHRNLKVGLAVQVGMAIVMVVIFYARQRLTSRGITSRRASPPSATL